MRKLLLLIPFVLIIIACKNDSNKSSDLIYLVPENASIIVKTKSVEGLKSVFKNNGFLLGVSEYNAIKVLESQLNYLNHLKLSGPMLIGFGKNDKDSLQISIAT